MASSQGPTSAPCLNALISLLFINLVFLSQRAESSASLDNYGPNLRPGEISTGTTIIAVRYRDGVVVGADTRTSVSGYVSNRFASKVAFVLDRGLGGEEERESTKSVEVGLQSDFDNSNTASVPESSALVYKCLDFSTCCVCRSGSAADTQSLSDICRDRLLYRSIVNRRASTVWDAAYLLRNLILSEPGVSASLICAGYDHAEQNGVIFSIAPSGSFMKEPEWSISGSGSSYVLGFIDANYPHGEADQWSEEEAVEFVTKCVGLAMERDGSSGGMIRAYVINRWGKKAIVRMNPSSRETAKAGESASDLAMPYPDLKGFAPPSRV